MHKFVSRFRSSTTSQRQTFGLQLPHASCVSIQRTECADTTKKDAARRRFKALDRKSDGRSIYHDSGDVDILTEASLRLGPTIVKSQVVAVHFQSSSCPGFSSSAIFFFFSQSTIFSAFCFAFNVENRPCQRSSFSFLCK